ncbi:MAG: hypothetical protein GY858_08910 [Candidatus Omnitrophica bacterium]|nr:hypothetical protein [Candidatus Omnitrophota bacterium]
MGNPLKDEEKIWQQIEDENISVHPVVWELLNHHVRNALMAITMGLQLLRMTPDWILNSASWVMRVLWKLSRQQGEPPEKLSETCDKGVQRTKDVDVFLRRLRKATDKSEG